MITPEDAANKFLERIIDVHKSVDQDFKTMLIEGLPGRVDNPILAEKWYQNLTENEKKLVHEVINASIKETIFRFLVVLDNMTGGPPIIGGVSDFALYVQTYADWQALGKNQPQEAFRFNTLGDIELHDLFLETLDEQ